MASDSLKLEQITRVSSKGTVSPPSLKEASIVGHTTSSVPRPHVVYVVRLVYTDGSTSVVGKRFSEFHNLFEALRRSTGSSFGLTFPPRRPLLISLVPAAWIDDSLLDERKAGLNEFLCILLNTEKTRNHPFLSKFFRSAFSSLALESLGEGFAQMQVTTRRVRRGDSEIGRGAPIVATYYPSWAAGVVPPWKVNWSKFDIVFFAFAIPTKQGTLNWPDFGREILKKLVKAIGGRKTRVVLSVGGWGGSHWFSEVVGNPVGRASFINAISSAIDNLGLHGVDIDWEYPNSTGAGNPHSPRDSDNFLQFLKSLRSRLGPDKIISAAVSHLPWLGSNGRPLTNVSEYAKLMTFVNIMNYDVWPASANPGPNAPLGDLCNTSGQPQANAKAAFSQWTKAGMPASKLLLGLATYGYVSKSKKKKLSGSSVSPLVPGAHPRFHRSSTREPDTPKEDAAPGDLSSYWGQQIAFNQLVRMGALAKQGDGGYGAVNGYTMEWDNCSDTPFLHNQKRETVVSYDDPYSLGHKAKYAKEVGMAGCFTWSLDQDDGLTLHEAVRTGLGL